MELTDAIAMLAPADLGASGPTTWADLGCGSGTFTRALASLLAAGSTIHAMDRDPSVLTGLPAAHGRVAIRPHCGDFTDQPWPFTDLDGILMANALHFVADPRAFIEACRSQPAGPPRLLIVEYDTERASRWVPYPVDRLRLQRLATAAGYRSIRMLGQRPSIYRRAPLYAAEITAVDTARQLPPFGPS
jgi:SAM-dependent methyltransferase